MATTADTDIIPAYYRSVYLVNGELMGEWEADTEEEAIDLTPLGEYDDFEDREGPTGFFLYAMTAEHNAVLVVL